MTLFDAQGRMIGKCLDTPNNFAAACVLCEDIAYGKVHYEFFGTTVRYADDPDIIDRMVFLANDDTALEYHKRKIKFY